MAPIETEWSLVNYIYNGYWFRHRRLLILNVLLLIPLMTSVINGLDSSLLNGLQILPAWKEYFNDPKGATLGLLSCAQFLGNLTGLPFSPYISDWLGRRAALFMGSLIMVLGVALQSSAWNVAMFIGARFTVGFGLSFCQNSAPLLLTELAYPTQRGRITSMFNSCWYFGSIISAWVCYGALMHGEGTQWSWRVPTAIQALLPIIQILSIWFIPESPRWLVSKGMESRAAGVLARFHTDSQDERDPLVMFEMAQIRHAIRMEEEINQSTSYASLFQTPGNRRRMRLVMGIAIFSQWSGNGLASYYIDKVLGEVGIDNPETKAIINGSLQVFNFVVAIAAALLVDVAGRRPLFLASNGGMLLAFTIWTIASGLYQENHNLKAGKAVVPFIFLFYFFYDLAYTPMLIAYTLEILPYRIRAKGFAVMNLVVMAAIAFNIFVNPWAMARLKWKYHIVYLGWLCLEFIFIYMFLVETKRRTLEETAALFDGDEPAKDLIAMGGEAADLGMRFSRGINVLSETYSFGESEPVQTPRKARSFPGDDEPVDQYAMKTRRYRSDSDSTDGRSYGQAL